MQEPIAIEKSELTNIKHAFFTRYGGVSKGPYEALNVGKHVTDQPDNVDKNRSLALNYIHVDPERFVFLGRLEHSNRIFEVGNDAAGVELSDHDVLLTTTPGLAIGLSVADCLPIILVDEEAAVLAMVHAGWRGLKVEVIRHAVEAMLLKGAQAGSIKAVIGPSIGPDSYEVGRDVADQFLQQYHRANKSLLHLDLWAIAEDQLRAAGVQYIDNLRIDTGKDERFFSHRRSKGKTGRCLVVASL